MRYWDSIETAGVVMDTYPFILAMMASWLLWRLAARAFTERGIWVRPKVKSNAIISCVAFFVVCESVALFVFVNIDIPFPPTEYAAGYTRAQYNKVRVGDTEKRLYQLIGKPLYVSEWYGEKLFFYSLSESGFKDSHWQRIVFIDGSTKKVSGKLASFYTGI